MRTRIGDEPAFLADQPVDVGRVQSDLPGAREHRVLVWHGVALAVVGQPGGALAGVDAPVPDFVLACQVGGSQELAVSHATGCVQVGGVVPFTHTLCTQPQRNGRQGTLEPRVGSGGLQLGWRQGRRRRRCGDGLAQLFQGQLAVERVRRSNGLEQFAGARRGIGAFAGLQAARQPVDPGGILLQGLGHGGHQFVDMVPLPGAQRCPHPPGQVVGVHVFGLAACKPARGLGHQALCGGFADDAPHPAAFFVGQLHLPAGLGDLLGRFGGRRAGQLDQRQRDQFLGAVPHGGELVVQVLGGLVLDGVGGLRPLAV